MLRTRSRSPVFIHFFPFVDHFVLVKLNLRKPQWVAVGQAYVNLTYVDFTPLIKALGLILPLQSLVIHGYLIHFKSVGLPQFFPSLFFPSLSLSFCKNTIAFVCSSLITVLTAILISSKLPNCPFPANPITSTPQVIASSKDD